MHLFQAKYLGICLTNTRNSEDDTTVGEASILTDVFYNKNKKVLQVFVSIVKQHDYNDRLYFVENSNNSGYTIHFMVMNNLSKRIKTFNKNRELI